MTALNRQKSDEYKELLANDELIKQTNADLCQKLTDEKTNFNRLQEGRIRVEETLKRTQEVLAIDTEEVKEQDLILAQLKKEIEAEQAAVDALEESVGAASVVKKAQDEKHRHVQQQNTALLAKQEFIEGNYDYTSTPNELNLEVFKKIVASNNDVNETVDNFVGKVDGVKKEVQKIIASRYSF